MTTTPEFTSPEELRVVIGRAFALMDEDATMGPKLRDADVPQRFEFSDVRSALALIPITKPLNAVYREMLAAEYPHLLA